MNSNDPLPVSEHPLEVDENVLRGWLEAATERILEHTRTLPLQPAGYLGDASEAAAELVEDVPQEGAPLNSLLDQIFGHCLEKSYNTAGPGYLAYIPGGGILQSALADLIAGAINRYTGVWTTAPMLVTLEMNVLRWFIDMVGLPRTARGVLLSGGSICNATALATARHEKLGDRSENGVIYLTDQSHHSMGRAAALTGFRKDQVRIVPSDDSCRMQVGVLKSMVDEDIDAGRRPFFVGAAAGTTNTGAIDPLSELADVGAAHDLWIHADAAYGGFFMLTESGREVLQGLERADSITLDPHKGLFLPYGTGALLVRDGSALHRAHNVHADYMPALQAGGSGATHQDFCEHGPELSRSFRGLRIWLPMKLHGVGAFRDCLQEKIDLARHASSELQEMEGMNVLYPPILSLLAFRLEKPGLSRSEENSLNQRLLDGVLARGRVWLTGTMIDGMFVLRICILSFRTHRDRVDECLEALREISQELLSE